MENISNLIVTAVAVIGAITAALIGGLTIWAFRDIRSRTRDILVQILATVMVGVVPIAGILVYFMLRPRETLAEGYVRALEEESLLASIEHQEFCPSCGRRVDADMVFCPTCHTKLRNPCPHCGRAVHLSWDLCPYCGEALQPEMPVVSKPRRQRITGAQAPAQPHTPLTSNTQPMTSSLPAGTPAAAQNGEGGAGLSTMLDKVGGVIEGLVDRISSRDSNGKGQQHAAKPYQPPPAPPAARRATPSSYTRPQPSADDNGEGNGNGAKSDTRPIKPLISREEPLE
jgi:RNA polymerase subunit RPABC4/transcription elongation factor Spt4